MIQLIDKYVTAFPLLFLTAMEAILLSWVYGKSKHRVGRIVKIFNGTHHPNSLCERSGTR